jgi:uncharacterized delta-60 repeat protein
MRKWILWTVVAYIMILMLTRNISFGDGDYRLAIGELDTEFNSGGSTPGIVVHHNAAGGNGDDGGLSIYVDNNGKIYVTGFSFNGRNKDMVIWRYNSNGTLDTTFNGTGIVVHDNAAGKNKVLSVANENRPKTNKKSIIEEGLSLGKKFEKSLPTKPLDPTMIEPISGDDEGNSIYVDSRGKIYVAGYSYNGKSRTKDMTIWRYNSDGSLDTTFDGDGIVVYNSAAGDDEGKSIYVDSEGKIYVTGYSYNGRNKDMTIWKLNNDGSLDGLTFAIGGVKTYDPAFATGTIGDDEGNSIYVDSEGKIYVTGKGQNDRGNTDMVIWKLNNDGYWDTSFFGRGVVVYDSHAGDDEGNSIYVDSRRRIYVTGYSYNGRNDDMVIWRYNSDGRIDSAFGGGLGRVVHHNAAGGNGNDRGMSIYVDERGEKIYVTGYSWAPPSSYRRYGNTDMVIWRYNKNGVLDTTFGEGVGFVYYNGAGDDPWDGGNSIYVDSTGKIYVTGSSFNGSNSDMVIWKYR